MTNKNKPLTKKCPECGCKDYINKDAIGEGYRECKNCKQEYWIDLDYTNPNFRC